MTRSESDAVRIFSSIVKREQSIERENMNTHTTGLNRRNLIKSAAVAGAGILLARNAIGEGKPSPASTPASVPSTQPMLPDPASKPFGINVALVGTGKQGRVLLNEMLKIPGLNFKAVCDIWDYNRKYGAGIVKRLTDGKQVAASYVDYQEMLNKEKGLDAVIVATPDWMHSPVTCAALKAGLHVYCEKEMANTLDAARAMVETSRSTGKLLQIGHQRRSNPRYLHALKLLTHDKVAGNITAMYGQWNRPVQVVDLPPRAHHIPADILEKYGYDTMERFYNWRWYKKFGGGTIADLGSHQIDVFSWFLGANPTSVVGSGGSDYFADREWYDQAMAIYQYPGKKGVVRAFYQVLNTTSNGDYYETIMGDEGSLQISENGKTGYFFRETASPRKPWEDEAAMVEKAGKAAIELKVGYTIKSEAERKAMENQMAKSIHRVHLENFFLAIRDGVKLNCPGELAYETTVAVLRVNDSIAADKRLKFKPEDFKA